jgi:YD repeat-containing protein
LNQYISTTLSNGDIIEKDIKYSSDYTGGVMTTLFNNNVFSMPVATKTMIRKGGFGSDQLLQETVTEFTQIVTGDIKPLRVIEQRVDKPKSSFSSYGGPGSSITGYKVLQEFTYDANGNLIGVKDEGARVVSNIYDYNDKYVAASVINAEPLVDKPAYTSFETDNYYGGWNMTGGPKAINNSVSITGARSFDLSGRTFTALLNTSKSYTLSFWTTNSNVTVSSGSSLTVSSPTINGFTYYEYNISEGTSSISISGTSTIDELRVYPKSSRMRTVTYDPLIGKTSEADEANRITYYDYDNLGRMRFIKDEKKNILKMFEYNNVSEAKLNGCPGTYSNKLITEKFVRSNCASGYVGDTIPYSVPAAMFTSTISQDDADDQAENYLLIHGPDEAIASGHCLYVWHNEEKIANVTSEGCGPGYTGGTYTYTVPAGRYSSVISQPDANQYALDEIAANAQAEADNPDNRVCNINTDPVWEWDGSTSYCTVTTPQYLMVYEKDLNPNSSTYNQYRWWNVGAPDVCPQLSGCISYTIHVPYSVATNLFISVTNCNNTTSLLNWNTQVIRDDIPEQNAMEATLCLKAGAMVTFRYGSSGSTVSVPEITVTPGAQCQ